MPSDHITFGTLIRHEQPRAFKVWDLDFRHMIGVYVPLRELRFGEIRSSFRFDLLQLAFMDSATACRMVKIFYYSLDI